mmetsp:Transcript_12053/g.10652  ORF Transcript_12053/g.10652 Transcript_12053/m.10652 type:complete len:247 (-) Transcript_12053:23-763(-)
MHPGSGRKSLSGRSSICGSESGRALGTTPSGVSLIKMELKDFQNLQSQLYQWILINQRLELSFNEQQTNALNEIYDRWIQIIKLGDEVYTQERTIFIKNQVLVLNKSLIVQNDYLTDLSLLFDQFKLNIGLLMKKVSDTMNIMTIESKDLYLQVEGMKENLDMANSLYDVLNQNTKNYDFEVLQELKELQRIINEEKEEFLKGIGLTKQYIQKQNKENMKMISDFCKKTEDDLMERSMNNPILAFF